jgi:hypothetical protein
VSSTAAIACSSASRTSRVKLVRHQVRSMSPRAKARGASSGGAASSGCQDAPDLQGAHLLDVDRATRAVGQRVQVGEELGVVLGEALLARASRTAGSSSSPPCSRLASGEVDAS